MDRTKCERRQSRFIADLRAGRERLEGYGQLALVAELYHQISDIRQGRKLALHASAAMIFSPLVVFVAILTAALLFRNSSSFDSVLNAGGVLNRLLWGPGLIFGILLNRLVLRRTACWVWLAGMVWMACGICAALYSYSGRFAGICSPLDSITNGFFFSVPKQPYCGDHGNLMLFTLPTLSAIAYSLGAWITLWFVRHARLSPDPVKQ